MFFLNTYLFRYYFFFNFQGISFLNQFQKMEKVKTKKMSG